MRNLFKKSSAKAGTPPGTLVHVGETKIEAARVTVITYDAEHVEEREVESVEECVRVEDRGPVSWINVDGLHEVEIIERLGACYDIHPLVLEDVLHTGHRAKLEDSDDYAYIVLKALDWDGESEAAIHEQVSVILGRGFVLSFQERKSSMLEGVTHRIREGKGRIRSRGADYLAYAIMDAVVDNYFVVLEKIGEHIEAVEEDVMKDPSADTLQELHRLREETLAARKAVWPLREVVNALLRGESSLFSEETHLFLRDVYDHLVEVVETLEAYRDLLGSMAETYLSVASNRMNEVMKVLTIIATIFIPITFVAGVYGMNFKYMPELAWRWAYPCALGLMALVAGVMLLYFRRRRWL